VVGDSAGIEAGVLGRPGALVHGLHGHELVRKVDVVERHRDAESEGHGNVLQRVWIQSLRSGGSTQSFLVERTQPPEPHVPPSTGMIVPVM